MNPLFDLPPFPGFREDGLQFMRDLKLNNERDWFKPRKSTYDDELVWPMQCLIVQLTREASASKLPYQGDPGSSIFRIYRDTRFSKNKHPYKTHIGAVLTRTGDRKEPGGVYIHVEPGGSFIAGGFWNPERDLLLRFRQRMAAFPEEFIGIVDDLRSKGLHAEPEEKLKRMPRGIDATEDHPAAVYLKWKSFVASRSVTDDELQDPAFAETVLTTMRDMLPLLEYGWMLEGPSEPFDEQQ